MLLKIYNFCQWFVTLRLEMSCLSYRHPFSAFRLIFVSKYAFRFFFVFDRLNMLYLEHHLIECVQFEFAGPNQPFEAKNLKP